MSKDIIEVSIEHDYLYELGSNDSPSEENLPTKDDDFLSLKISHFLSGKISPISLYLRLGDNHYVKVVNHGSSFEPRSLMSWYSKGLRVVYFSKYEYSKIQKFQHKVLNKVRKDIEAGNDPHPSILLKQGDQILHLFEQTLSSDVLTDLDSFFQTVKALSKSAKMNHKSKFAASFFSANLGYSHGVSSVMATAALLREMGLSSDPILKTLYLGSMFHDIGLTDDFPDIDHEFIIPDDPGLRKKFEDHPLKSVSMLSNVPIFSSASLQMIRQHHMRPKGRSFPARQSDEALLEGSLIIGMADDLVNSISVTMKSFNMQKVDILRDYLESYVFPNYHRPMIQATRSLLERF